MAALLAHDRLMTRSLWRSRISQLAGGAVSAATILAAAIRVAAAVESRAQPAPADLKILGISGELSLPR